MALETQNFIQGMKIIKKKISKIPYVQGKKPFLFGLVFLVNYSAYLVKDRAGWLMQ